MADTSVRSASNLLVTSIVYCSLVAELRKADQSQVSRDGALLVRRLSLSLVTSCLNKPTRNFKHAFYDTV